MPLSPKESFRALLQQLMDIVENMHEQCFKAQTPEHMKKIMNMTLRQGKALRTISVLTQDKPEGVPLKLLAERMGMTAPATSLLVESMVMRGFFDRLVNPDDRRSVRIKLSEKGRENFERITAAFIEQYDRLFCSLSPDELAAFSSIIRKLYTFQCSEKP